MTIQSVLLPVFVLVLLIFSLLFFLVKENQGGAHAAAQRFSACFSNQSELPPLFLILAVLAIMTRKADFLFVIMEWLFVLTRLGHAFIFATSNRQPHRGIAFILGALVLLIMWIIFAVRILVSPTFGAL